MRENSNEGINKLKIKVTLLLIASIITGFVYLFSYIAYFGFEYEHRFREDYIGPSVTSRSIGISMLVIYILLILISSFYYNRNMKTLFYRSLNSIKQAIIIMITGFLVSFPIMFPAYLTLLYE